MVLPMLAFRKVVEVHLVVMFSPRLAHTARSLHGAGGCNDAYT